MYINISIIFYYFLSVIPEYTIPVQKGISIGSWHLRYVSLFLTTNLKYTDSYLEGIDGILSTYSYGFHITLGTRFRAQKFTN